MAAGVDDPLRPRSDADEVAGHLEAMFAALTAQGTRLATLTFPDVTPITPLARPVRHRVTALNHRVRAAAHRHGGDVAETGATPSSPIPGCGARTACAPVPSATSASPPSPTPPPRPAATTPGPTPCPPSPAGAAEPCWAAGFLGPWIVRRLRGRSSGDGRAAERPRLAPPDAEPARQT
ncbi:hypothetical protein L0F81_09805 [Streptomyces tricolor]|uniref:Uncharacterized protein n=1 Tax=Streptomyces tricolor TaxID=68277 RepID=A0ABS9JDE4_9ACTN|nr:hypothetical protein [Streptomyces tricolor]